MGLIFWVPGLIFKMPGFNFQKPGLDFPGHGSNFPEPGLNFSGPGSNFKTVGLIWPSWAPDLRERLRRQALRQKPFWWALVVFWLPPR